MAEARHSFVVAILLAVFHGGWGWKCAVYRNLFDQQPEYIYCPLECCGNSFNRHCCVPSTTIVGFTLGAAVFLAALILALCYFYRRHRETKAMMKNRYPAASMSVMGPG